MDLGQFSGVLPFYPYIYTDPIFWYRYDMSDLRSSIRVDQPQGEIDLNRPAANSSVELFRHAYLHIMSSQAPTATTTFSYLVTSSI